MIRTYGINAFLFMVEFTFCKLVLLLKPNRLLLSVIDQAQTHLSPAQSLLALWWKNPPDVFGND